MAYFNPQPYSAAMPDLLSNYLQGQQMGQEAQTMRSSHEMQRAQQALKTQMYNRLLQNQQPQQQMPMQMGDNMPMQQQQMPMQMSGNMPMQHQQIPVQMGGGMPMQRGSNLNMQDMILQNELLGLPKGKIENIDGQNYYIMPTGEYYPVGPAAPTEREKLFTKSDVDKYNDVQNEYNELVSLDDAIEGLSNIAKSPQLKDYFSNISNDYLRSGANKALAMLGGEDRARFVTELNDYANKLITAAAGKFKGNFTNKELSFLQGSKPSANDRPEVLIQKITDLKKFHDLAKQRTESISYLMRYHGMDYSSAAKIAKESAKAESMPEEMENKIQEKMLEGNEKEMPEQIMPIREQVEEAPGFIREKVEMPGAYYDLEEDSFDTPDLGLIRGLRRFGANEQTGFDKLAEPLTRGSAQALYDMPKSIINMLPDAIKALTGYESPRLPNLDIQNPEATGSEAILQNLGNMGTSLAATGAANAALGLPGKISSTVQSLGLAPKSQVLANILAHGGAGALEGVALGEGNRAFSGLAGGALGSAFGAAKGAHEYYKGIQHETIGKELAKNIPAAERSVGNKISQSLKNAEEAGASIKVEPKLKNMIDSNDKIAKSLKSRYKNDWHAVSEFSKNPTLENAHWAQSALGKIESNLSAPAKQSHGNKFNQHMKEYAKELSNKIKSSISQAFHDAKMSPSEYTDALSEYADLARISKSEPVKKIKSLGLNARSSDYEKLAKSIASDTSLSGLASPYSKGLPERNQLDKLYDSLYKIGLITTPPLAGTMAYDYLSNALSREQ